MTRRPKDFARVNFVAGLAPAEDGYWRVLTYGHVIFPEDLPHLIKWLKKAEEWLDARS